MKERELSADSVIKNYLTTASDGMPYDVMYYSLQMIIAIGFRVRGVRGTQFRQWANAHLSEYLVKGFTMDDERLKNPGGRCFILLIFSIDQIDNDLDHHIHLICLAFCSHQGESYQGIVSYSFMAVRTIQDAVVLHEPEE